jgi:HK97 family phage portal protein
MGILTRVLHFWDVSKRSSQGSLTTPGWWSDLFGGVVSDELVNEKRAMRISTVFICQLILAETLASLTWNVYQKTSSGNEVLSDHPVQLIFKKGPNEYSTFSDFMRAIVWHASGYGGGYAKIKRNGYRDTVELELWDCPGDVKVYRDSKGKPYYNYKGKDYDPDDLLIIKRFTLDGVTPLSPIKFNAETMGFAVKQQKYRQSTFGVKPPGYLTSDMPITGKDQVENVQQYGRSFKQATLETGDIPVLYGGLRYNHISFAPADLQLLEMSEATKEDIYGIFRIPPVFAQNYRRATFDNAEKQDLVLGKYTLLPWCTCIEQEFNKKLFRVDETKTFTKANMNALLRADYKTRMEGYKSLFGIGAMSANNIAELEDWNPVEGGDRRYVPMNMIPTDKVDEFFKKLTTIPTTKQTSNEERASLEALLAEHGIKLNGHEHS